MKRGAFCSKSRQAMGEASFQTPHPLCITAGRRRGFLSCFVAVLHDADGFVDETIGFFHVFAAGLYNFPCFFCIFA